MNRTEAAELCDTAANVLDEMGYRWAAFRARHAAHCVREGVPDLKREARILRWQLSQHITTTPLPCIRASLFLAAVLRAVE